MLELSYILGWASTFMQGVAILVGVFHWKRLSSSQQLLLAMLTLVMLNYVVSRIFVEFERNSYPFFYCYIGIELTFLVLLFKQKVRALSSAQVAYPIIGFGLLFTLASGAFWQSYWSFPTYARAMESLLVVGFCTSYFVQVLRNLDVENLERTFMFWVTTGLLVYFATNACITIFGSVLATEAIAPVWGAIWSIHGVLNILLYLAFAIAFMCRDTVLTESRDELLYP